MPNHPKIIFKIDPKQDIKVLESIIKESDSLMKDQSLKWAIEPHPYLKQRFKNSIFASFNIKDIKNIKDITDIIRYYIWDFYKKNRKEIEKKTAKIKKEWSKLEGKFYKLGEQIFQGYSWPNKEYVAYPTILGLYSRDIKNKSFQFPYSHPISGYSVAVIAHELLHFIFYDYFFKNYPQYKKPNKSLFVWHISEIFNSVIQKSNIWKEIFRAELLDYPFHKEIIKKLKKQYRQQIITDLLIESILEELKRTEDLNFKNFLKLE